MQVQPAGCGRQLVSEEHSAWRVQGGSSELQQAWAEVPLLVVLACMLYTLRCGCSRHMLLVITNDARHRTEDGLPAKGIPVAVKCKACRGGGGRADGKGFQGNEAGQTAESISHDRMGAYGCANVWKGWGTNGGQKVHAPAAQQSATSSTISWHGAGGHPSIQ